jgi:hypothetical protein
VITVKEGVPYLTQRGEGGQELTMGDFTAEVSPPQLNRVSHRLYVGRYSSPNRPAAARTAASTASAAWRSA